MTLSDWCSWQVQRLGCLTSRSLVAPAALLGFLASCLVVATFDSHGWWLADFRGTLWAPSERLLRGATLYPDAVVSAGQAHYPYSTYPAPTIWAATPLHLLPYWAAAGLWVIVLLAGTCATLILVGVRDWRCWVLWLSGPAFVAALVLGNATILGVLAAAATWRLRNRPVAAGATLAVGILLKPFLWPLVLWLLLTRRYKATVVTTAVLASTAAVWAIVDIRQFRLYPHFLEQMAIVERHASVSFYAVVRGVGGSDFLGRAASLLLVAAALLVAWRLWKDRDEAGSFAVVLCVSPLAAPVAWNHEYAAALLAVAILRPRWSRWWLLAPAVAVPFAASIGACALALIGRRPRPEKSYRRAPVELAA